MSTPYTRGFVRDMGQGRVFMRVRLDEKDVAELSSSLRFATTQGALSNLFELQAVADESLDFLRSRFPIGRRTLGGHMPTYTNGRLQKKWARIDSKPASKLHEGWRAKVFEQESPGLTKSLLGFRLFHEKERNRRAQVIIASMNYGSRAHIIRPKNVDWLKVGVPYYDTDEIYFWSEFLKIPARKGMHFIKATQDYVQKYYGARSNFIIAQLRRLIERGVKPEKRISRASFTRAPLSPIRQATRAFSISIARSMSRAVTAIADTIRVRRRK